MINKRYKNINLAGMKKTSQRAVILEVIGRGHLGADEIYRLAHAKMPRLSLATVYRTMHKLKELGIIEELHFNETRHHYEIKPILKHQHIVCLDCGKVMEFKYQLSPQIKRRIIRERGFEVTGAEIQIVGYCEQCRELRNNV